MDDDERNDGPGRDWAALFDRAADHATTETAVRAALRARREREDEA